MSTSEPTSVPVPADESAPLDENATDAATRIKTLLRDLFDTSRETFAEIERLSKQEVERVGEDTDEGRQWNGLAAFGLFTDVSAAERNITREIAAVRGMLVYRGLDQPPKP